MCIRDRGWSTVSASGGSGCNERTGGEDSSHRIERAMSMAECKQAVLVEKETAHRDCLTGCYDRMTIRHLVDLCFLKSDVRQSHAMFVIDVDNFKRVNDTWGREFGDIVLNDVAAVLRRIFRRSDYIGDVYKRQLQSTALHEMMKRMPFRFTGRAFLWTCRWLGKGRGLSWGAAGC